MVNAELRYNPYILDTHAKFNEKEPRVNSVIKKYEKTRLQDWIKEVPRVFYEELNGYDYHIDFYGTKLEFNELERVFAQTIPDESYEIVHCGVLESRKVKLSYIEDTLNWLKNTDCDYFNYEDFCIDNNTIIDVHYPLFIINGKEEDIIGLDELNVSAEFIDDLSELESTNLQFAPFIIFVNENNNLLLKSQIDDIRKRKNVNDSQLFFILRDKSKEKTMERFLKDLGIDNPQIVEGSDDDKIYDYLNAYPITQHIYEVCQVFGNIARKISEELKNEKQKKESESSEKYSKIEELSLRIDKIVKTKTRFSERSPIYHFMEWKDAEENFLKNVNKFKENNVMLIGSESAEKAANSYQQEVAKNLIKHFTFIEKTTDQFLQKKKNEYRLMYLGAEINDSYEPNVAEISKNNPGITDFRPKLMDNKVERIVEEKSIFSAKDEPPKKVLRREYMLSNWRKIAVEEVQLILNKVSENYFGEIIKYTDSLAEGYVNHLSDIENTLTHEKDLAMNSLSEEEKRLEKNINWLKEFSLKISNIERREVANEKGIG